jgi:ATP-dependent helicase/nuclease subunit B
MNEIAKNHHVTTAWRAAMAQIRQVLHARQVQACDAVVLVPFAQLMHEAREAWAFEGPAASFVPRFETTQNWVKSVRASQLQPDDLHMDAALDVLCAARWLARAGLQAHQALLAPRLMEAAWSLAKVASAIAPSLRSAWGVRLAGELTGPMEAPQLAYESAIGQLALAWAASSRYPTDPLFNEQPELLFVLEGFQTEPLANALRLQQGERGISIALHGDLPANADMRLPALHSLQDVEDEAQAAAACVLRHIAAGQSPVALVALDRVLTRRVRATLGEHGVRIRDETGWKLSTTRAAATMMSLLRACAWNASTDAVLDCLKNAPTLNAKAVQALETALRADGLRDWAQAPADKPLVATVQTLRESLADTRPLGQWLTTLGAALAALGQWVALKQDDAGRAVLRALHMEATFYETTPSPGVTGPIGPWQARMRLAEFTQWVSQTLEAESFSPPHPVDAQVIILPLSQLLGRKLPAVVLPGCDEVHLPASPQPIGNWTPAQRQILGLPTRDSLASANRQAWHHALAFTQSQAQEDAQAEVKVDVLWRHTEGGERVLPSIFVQELLLVAKPAPSSHRLDARVLRALQPQPCMRPAPQGGGVAIQRLSASSYEDLRRCPYRFFALRLLRLQDPPELEAELDKRDFGNWLHTLLKHFHLALKKIDEEKSAIAPVNVDKLAMINVAADLARTELGLTHSEFLPYAAAWPRVRSGYLQWLADHEASGAVFDQAEVWKEMPLGPITLIGKLDRVDQQTVNGLTVSLVMDYKTEARTATSQRVAPLSEDTQLAFYGALLSDDTLAAAYVNLGEKDITKTYPQTHIVALRDQLLEGIQDDMARVAQGAPLPALGEGKACDFCAARGLCRKDFWEADPIPASPAFTVAGAVA